MICGTGTNSTAESIELTEMAEKAGATAALVVTPYYNKPPQRALTEHFSMVAASTALPVILYNIPSRTVVKIEHDTMMALASVDNIVAGKEATSDYAAVARMITDAPSGFEVIAGSDEDTFGFVCLGGTGVISVSSHFVGSQMGDMIRLVQEGDVASARKIHLDILPLIDALFCTASPIPLKAGLAMTGLPGGPPRPPMFEATETERETVRKALANAGIL
jgi:4-hydroxy-tetrahydrodipicolinate synthase